MQPLDIGFFGLLKTAYTRECDNWMISNPGKVITQMQVSGLFGAAYAAVANIQKAQNSFKAAGIVPYNDQIFNEVDFAPSLVIDVDTPTETNNRDVISRTTGSKETIASEPADALFLHATPPAQPADEINLLDLDIICDDGTVVPSQTEDTGLSQDKNPTYVPIENILPLPHFEGPVNRRKAKSQKSEILSSTPYKDEMERCVQEREEAEQAKRVQASKRKIVSSGPGLKSTITKKGPNKRKATKSKSETKSLCLTRMW